MVLGNGSRSVVHIQARETLTGSDLNELGIQLPRLVDAYLSYKHIVAGFFDQSRLVSEPVQPQFPPTANS